MTAIEPAPVDPAGGGVHPLLASVAEMSQALDSVAGVDPVYLRTGEKAELLLGLSRVTARLDELRLRVMAVAGDVAADEGARDVAAWLGCHARADRSTARREARLAAALEHRWRQVAAGVAAGTVSLAQAEAIVTGLEELPGDLDPAVRDAAEEHLVGQASEFGPQQLRILTRRVLEVVAPDVAEDHERRRLEAEERRARRRCRLTSRGHGDGTTTITALLPDPVASRLMTYLEAYTAPRHAPGETGDSSARGIRRRRHRRRGPRTAGVCTAAGKLSYPARLGRAFCELLEHLDPARLPLHGGDATTVVVTIDYDQLRDDLGTATLDETPVTASHARRLACTAAILPAVLGGASQVLDLGRSRRLFTPAQRRALAIRDRRCRAHGCDIPARWCEAHHRTPWSHGGPTDLDHGELLCSHHHHRIHDPGYDHHRDPDGTLRFHRRV